jgi:hypothetical protein
VVRVALPVVEGISPGLGRYSTPDGLQKVNSGPGGRRESPPPPNRIAAVGKTPDHVLYSRCRPALCRTAVSSIGDPIHPPLLSGFGARPTVLGKAVGGYDLLFTAPDWRQFTVNLNNMTGGEGLIGNIARGVRDFLGYILGRVSGSVDLSEKLILIDNDELLLVWESKLRNQRMAKEKEAWDSFERTYGRGNPQVVDSFIKWQEQLYAYIEQEKEHFLKQRKGSGHALAHLRNSGVTTVCVTKGAKPYTQKCFDLVGLTPTIADTYSPAPGRREKRFVDAVIDYGKNSSTKCLRDTLIVGHDLDNDMAWDLVPVRGDANDGKSPVFIMFDTMAFDKEVAAPLDALPEIIDLLARKGGNDFLRGFRAITTSKRATTKNYSFNVTLFQHPRRADKARIPIICNIIKRRASSGGNMRFARS